MGTFKTIGTIGIAALILICIPFGFYFFIGTMSWFFSDPFDLVETYVPPPLTKEEDCRREVRFVFNDIVDTMGVNTNNQDSISKTMLEMYDRCVAE